MLSLEQYIFFRFDRIHLLLLKDDVFVLPFHRIHFTSLDAMYKKDMAKGAFINDFLDYKVI